MKLICAICVFLASAVAFGQAIPPEGYPGDWVNIVNIAFGPGYSDMANAGNNVHIQPATTDRFAMLIANDCNDTRYDEMYVRSGSRWFVEFKDYQEVDRKWSQFGQWVFFSVTTQFPPTMVGYRVVNQGNHVCHTEVWQRRVSQPPPPPPPPGVPTMRQCEKVAFDLKYEYEFKIEQASAVAGTLEKPCFVYIRFSGLDGYRYFIDNRQQQGKSPDFEMMQPENVKVELTHAVIL